MKILNVCSIHSGSKYMAELWQALGPQVLHEADGKHGLVSCIVAGGRPIGLVGTMAMPSWMYDEPDRFTHAVYSMRYPPDNLASIVTRTAERWQRVKRLFGPRVNLRGDTQVEQAAWLLIEWHRLCLAWDPSLVLPVEDAPGRLGEWILRNCPDLLKVAASKFPAKNTHSRGKRLVVDSVSFNNAVSKECHAAWMELMAFYEVVRSGGQRASEDWQSTPL